MVKDLLGIVCSPRKFGNSELFIKELYRQLTGEWRLTLVRLPELDIRPCRACYQCLFGEMQCRQDDDFAVVLQALIESDAYVVAAPTYLLGPNASLKRFLDRGLAFYAHLDRLWGKPAVGVAIAGITGMEGYTKLAVESFVKLTFGDLGAPPSSMALFPVRFSLKVTGPPRLSVWQKYSRRRTRRLIGQFRTVPSVGEIPFVSWATAGFDACFAAVRVITGARRKASRFTRHLVTIPCS